MASIAIVYKSIHHSNTKKLLDVIRSVCKVDIFDVEEARHMDMSVYKAVGFASGIYMSRLHESIYEFLDEQESLPKKTFAITTSGSKNKKYGLAFSDYLSKKDLEVLGVYSCKGFNTNGIFGIIGGIAKNHPNDSDMAAAISFIKTL